MLCPFACRCVLLGVIVVKLLSQLPAFLLFRDRQRIAQQWIRLHSSSKIVGATYAHYIWSPKSYRLYPSHDALQVPTLLGGVASVCTLLPTRTQKLPSLLAQQCWKLLRPVARSFREPKQRRWRFHEQTTALHAHAFLVHFFDIHCTTTMWNLLMRRFMEDINILSLFEAG